jgi:F-type H+-transporting ATPase subunit delta
MAGAAAKRYARAIFELASEEGQVEEWGTRLATVGQVFSRQDVRVVLSNPTIPRQQRQEAVSRILDDSAGPEGANLAKLLVGANRLDDVERIEQEYQLLVDEMGREIRLTADVDPAIIGGLVLRVGDHVIDASLATRLRQLRRKLAGV